MSRARVLAIARILGKRRRGADRVGGQVVALAGMRSALPLPADADATTTTIANQLRRRRRHTDLFLLLSHGGANKRRCLSFKFLAPLDVLFHTRECEIQHP